MLWCSHFLLLVKRVRKSFEINVLSDFLLIGCSSKHRQQVGGACVLTTRFRSRKRQLETKLLAKSEHRLTDYFEL